MSHTGKIETAKPFLPDKKNILVSIILTVIKKKTTAVPSLISSSGSEKYKVQKHKKTLLAIRKLYVLI